MKPFRVYQDRCNECLYSKDKIVSDARRRDLIEQTKDGWFVCHKASILGESVCCKGNYDSWPSKTRQLAEELDLIEFVPLPDAPAKGA